LSQLPAFTVKEVLFIGAEGIFASLLGHFCYYYALKLGDVTRVSPILAAAPVITVIAAVLLLGEKLTLNKLAGIAAVILGVLLLKK
jgi:transporter family protein